MNRTLRLLGMFENVTLAVVDVMTWDEICITGPMFPLYVTPCSVRTRVFMSVH
jgi:hypothetical protein